MDIPKVRSLVAEAQWKLELLTSVCAGGEMDIPKVRSLIAEAQWNLKLLDGALDLGDMKAVGAAQYGLEHSLDALCKMFGDDPAPARQGRGESSSGK